MDFPYQDPCSNGSEELQSECLRPPDTLEQMVRRKTYVKQVKRLHEGGRVTLSSMKDKLSKQRNRKRLPSKFQPVVKVREEVQVEET